MLAVFLSALALAVVVQVFLVVTVADRLPAEAITGREPQDAVLPTANGSGGTRVSDWDAAGGYARAI